MRPAQSVAGLLSEHLDPVTCEEVDEPAIREFARKWLADRPRVV